MISICIVLILGLIKTLFYLRIFDNMSYMVTLLRQVVYDLQIFLIFFLILIFFLSLIIGVLGFQNFTHDEDEWNQMLAEGDYPGVEYHQIGRFLGNMITVLRMAIGDNDLAAIVSMTNLQSYMFWVMWLIIVFLTCIIFLNFIIAEASASYERVSEQLDNYLFY